MKEKKAKERAARETRNIAYQKQQEGKLKQQEKQRRLAQKAEEELRQKEDEERRRRNAELEKQPTGRTFEKDYKAVLKDGKLERELLAVLNRHVELAGWQLKFTRMKIANYDWEVERSHVGIPFRKTIDTFAYGVSPAGTCIVEIIAFSREYDGQSYAEKPMYYAKAQRQRIDCS